MRARRTILLTSFGGFPGAPVNPSQAVAALALQFARGRLQRLGIDLVCENLPVVFALTGPTLSALFAQHRPQAVLHLGLAASRRAVTPESRALNRLTLRHADARDQRSKGNAVLPGGAAILPASLSAARLTRVLRASGLPAAVSRSAGDYICNQALYLSLSAARAQAAPPCKVGFIHLPRPGSSKQTPDRLARPGIAAMGRAVGACLLDMARYI